MKVLYVCFALTMLLIVLAATDNLPQLPFLTDTVSDFSPFQTFERDLNRGLNPGNWLN